jgi:hypothetical protein
MTLEGAMQNRDGQSYFKRNADDDNDFAKKVMPINH